MDTLSAIGNGFLVSFEPRNLLFCFIGVFLGTVVGLLPGLGPAMAIALLLPLTVGLEPVTALIMLAGLYYGCAYGGSTTSILVNTPGDSSSVVAAFDGYPMARAGRAGPALCISALASFIAGTFSVVLLMLMAPLFASVALRFGPPEILALIVLAFIGSASFSGSRSKSMMMVAAGVLIASVGIDAQTGSTRFTFGYFDLIGGINFLPVVIGLFALSEILNLSNSGGPPPIRTRLRDMFLTADDWRRTRGASIRSGLLGFGMGLLPGVGPTIASFVAYDFEKRISPRKEEFGKGSVEGLAGTEAANNAAVNGAFVPTLVLGIPGSATTAILLGGFIMYGIQPGPLLLTQQPDLVWGLITSFYIGNVILLVLNLPMAPIFASLLRVPYAYLYPLIIVFCLLGSFADEIRMWGVYVCLAAGAVGYFMKKFDYPFVPLILGMILGGMFEKSLSQSYAMFGGDFSLFLNRPIAVGVFVLSGLLLAFPLLQRGWSHLRLRPQT